MDSLMMRKVIYGLLLMVMSCVASAARDPTMPMNGAYAVAGSGNDGTEVSMVLVSSQRRIAVVGGNFVHVGDFAGDQKIIAINPDAVTMQNTVTGEIKVHAVIATDIKTYAH